MSQVAHDLGIAREHMIPYGDDKAIWITISISMSYVLIKEFLT